MADDYEREYMGGGEALYAERTRNARVALPALLGFGAALGVSAFLSGGSLVALLAALGVGAVHATALVLFFAFKRVTVTKEHVHVQFGLFGPKIPVSAITRVEGFPAPWIAAYASGASGVVRITWTKPGGGTAETFVTSNDPGALEAAIQRARGGAPRAHVRVDAAADAAEVVEEEVAADDAADEERRAARD